MVQRLTPHHNLEKIRQRKEQAKAEEQLMQSLESARRGAQHQDPDTPAAAAAAAAAAGDGLPPALSAKLARGLSPQQRRERAPSGFAAKTCFPGRPMKGCSPELHASSGCQCA